MSQVIQTLITAVENLPSPNAGAVTMMEYQHKILSPAIQQVKDFDDKSPTVEEFEVVLEIIDDIIELHAKRQKILQALVEQRGANLIEFECIDLKRLKSFSKKDANLLTLEEVEDICA